MNSSLEIDIGGEIASSNVVEEGYRVDLLVAEMRPTPNLAKKRPARKRGMLTATVWRMTPKMNTIDDRMRPKRRLAQSARERYQERRRRFRQTEWRR